MRLRQTPLSPHLEYWHALQTAAMACDSTQPPVKRCVAWHALHNFWPGCSSSRDECICTAKSIGPFHRTEFNRCHPRTPAANETPTSNPKKRAPGPSPKARTHVYLFASTRARAEGVVTHASRFGVGRDTGCIYASGDPRRRKPSVPRQPVRIRSRPHPQLLRPAQQQAVTAPA